MHNPQKIISGIRKRELKKKKEWSQNLFFKTLLKKNSKIKSQKLKMFESWELKLKKAENALTFSTLIFEQYASNLNYDNKIIESFNWEK